MHLKHDPLAGKALYTTSPPGTPCRYVATARGNYYVPVGEPSSAAAMGICPSCGEQARPGEPTCGESSCLAGEPPPARRAQGAPGEPPAPPPALPPPKTVVAAGEALLEPQRLLSQLPPAPREEYTISDLLSRADPPDKETGTPIRYATERLDIDRRAMAKSRIMGVVAKAGQVTTSDQMRYELALQAKNENVRAMALFEPEANVLGLTVADLVGRIIDDRRTRERRMMQVYAILARASTEIDGTSGVAIDALADRAVQEIGSLEDT